MLGAGKVHACRWAWAGGWVSSQAGRGRATDAHSVQAALWCASGKLLALIDPDPTAPAGPSLLVLPPAARATLRRLLSTEAPTQVIVSGLLIISQLARSTDAHYNALASSGLVSHMPSLLRHPEATVRARSCNLLGNLCRHRCGRGVCGAWGA